jgi:hypothetical protein
MPFAVALSLTVAGSPFCCSTCDATLLAGKLLAKWGYENKNEIPKFPKLKNRTRTPHITDGSSITKKKKKKKKKSNYHLPPKPLPYIEENPP